MLLKEDFHTCAVFEKDQMRFMLAVVFLSISVGLLPRPIALIRPMKALQEASLSFSVVRLT